MLRGNCFRGIYKLNKATRFAVYDVQTALFKLYVFYRQYARQADGHRVFIQLLISWTESGTGMGEEITEERRDHKRSPPLTGLTGPCVMLPFRLPYFPRAAAAATAATAVYFLIVLLGADTSACTRTRSAVPPTSN